MRRWKLWSVAACVLLIAASYAFVSFWAAADLGDDTTARGRSILEFWGYSMLGLFGAAVIASVIAVYARLASRRDVMRGNK